MTEQEYGDALECVVWILTMWAVLWVLPFGG